MRATSIQRSTPCVFSTAPVARASVGFTLIEILAALVIISATGLGIVLSARPITSRSRLVAAGEEFALLLDTLSTRASITRTAQVISFTLGDGRLQALPLSADETEYPWVHTLPYGVSIREISLNGRILDRNNAQLLIQPSGYMQDATFCLAADQERLYVTWQGFSARGHLGEIGEASETDHKYGLY